MSVQVIGAGLAGLAAACRLVEAGQHVVLHEAAKFAGGRARSYDDPVLGCRIDNGNHLLLSGNHAAMAFLARIGASDTLSGPQAPVFPFIDLADGARWDLRLNRSRIPWWIFAPSRRVPGTGLRDYAALLKLRRAGLDDLVAPMVGGAGPLYRKLLEPLAIAALNTMPEIASAAPLAAVVAETIERGGHAAVPRFAKIGLSESFIDPAIEWLRAKGADIRFGQRVTAIDPAQPTVLAVPPWVAATLVPGLVVPDAFEFDLQSAFPVCVSTRRGGVLGDDRRDDRMGVCPEGHSLGHDFGGQPLCGAGERGDCGKSLGGAGGGVWAARRDAGTPGGVGAAGDVHGDTGAVAAPAEGPDGKQKPRSGGGLDGYGAARDDRRGDPLRRYRGGGFAWVKEAGKGKEVAAF